MTSVTSKTEHRTSEIPRLSASEWMLCLLNADHASTIKGKTVFVKQLFILGKELFEQVDRGFQFYPHRFGPYSRIFEDSLYRLIADGYVSESLARIYINQQPDKVRSDYALLPKGREEASRVISRLSDADRSKLDRYKRIMSSMGFWGLIHYVYSNYPEYTTVSEIAVSNQMEV